MGVGEVVEFFDGGELGGADVEFEIACQILIGDAGGPAAGGGVFFDDFADVGEAGLFGLLESLWEVAEIDAGARGPDGEDEGEAGEIFPGAAEVELMLEAGGFFADDFVADQ